MIASFGQRDLGTITGTITDPQGAAIPAAKITITEDATGLSYQVEAGTSGDYTRPALKPGLYTITAEAPGFRRAAQKNVTVTGGDRIGVSLTLTVGDVSQAVEVSADAPLLQTESTTLGANLTSKSVSELPLGGQRTFAFLARLSPGVLVAETGARDAVGGGFSANGVRSNGQNNFLLNGVDNNVNVIDFINQAAYVIGPSVEAIGEMQVLTNGYSAEYGRGAGGVVNVNLKSGDNSLHGSLFEYLQNDKLNANRWENNKAGKAKGAVRQNQYGITLGGPIKKNRTFIFGDYQGTRIASTGGSVPGLGYSGFYTIPSLAQRNGDFSALLGSQIGVDGLGRPILQNAIYDPKSTRTVNGVLVRDMFPGNIIPSNQFDPVAKKLLALFPTPNQSVLGGKYPQNNNFVSTAGKQVTDQGDVRVDHKLSDKNTLFGSLSWSNNNRGSVAPIPGPLDAAGFNGVNEDDLGRNAQIGFTRVWSPSIITETRAAFSRLVTTRVGENPNVDLFTQFGIGGYNPSGSGNGGLPQIGVGRYNQFGANDWLPTKEYNNVWDFIQNVAISKGAHAMKFGAEYRPIKLPFFQVPYPHGELTFSQNDTAVPTTANGTNGVALNTATGDEIASFLLGRITGGQISTTNFISTQKSAWAFYGQDDWKVSKKLTVSLGLRYELFSPFSERFGRQSSFDIDTLTLYIPKGPNQNDPLPSNFATQFPNVKVSRGEVSKEIIPWDKTDFGPRIGLAYQVREKTVARVGYGIFYGGEENQGGNPNRGESAPFNFSPLLNRPAGVGIFETNPYFVGGLAAGYPSNVFNLAAPVQFRSIAKNFRNSLVHKWNFALQHELPGQVALEVAYVGNHQAHQLFQPDPNACPNFGTTDTSINCNSLRPYPNIGSISGTASFGYGNYHGMTAKLEKRYSNGLQFLTAYTYGHALANTGTTLSGSTGFGIPDPRNYASGYSSAAWDIRHNFTSSFVYEIPFGKGKRFGSGMSNWMNTAVGGWQLNGILAIHTGAPYTLRSNACAQGVWNACRPDLVAGKNPQDAPAAGRNPDHWFDTTAVKPPAFLTGGNLGLQSQTAPAARTLDASLFKSFAISERFKVQFRAEGFNVANTPQYGTPNNNLQDANFGRVTGTAAGTERKFQGSLRLQF